MSGYYVRYRTARHQGANYAEGVNYRVALNASINLQTKNLQAVIDKQNLERAQARRARKSAKTKKGRKRAQREGRLW